MTRWPHFSTKCRKDVDRILRTGRLTAYRANAEWGVGPQKWSQVYAFEREVERKFKVKHCIAVNSGTAALHASLVGLGVSGKDVITSPFTFSATASAILLAGGNPVFADVDPHTFCLSKETVAPYVTKNTAAILPVHLFGYFQDLEGLASYGFPIIEDACQAVGASRGESFAGTYGVAGCYSFNGSKNLPSGEGGCLVTNSDEIAEKARLLVNHGCNFGWDQVGYNYRLTELHACLARHGLKALDQRNKQRAKLARMIFPWLPEWPEHVYYCTAFRVKGNRKKFTAFAKKRGLLIGEGYTMPLHHLRAFRRYCTRELPIVDELYRRSLCLLYCVTPEKTERYARFVNEVIYDSGVEVL